MHILSTGMPQLSKRAVFFHALRLFIYGAVIKHAKRWLQKYKKGFGSRLVAVLALLFGTAIYQFFNTLLDKILTKSMNMWDLTPFDEFWLNDSKDSLANCSGYLRFSKFPF
jgi:hypothetical protein